MFGISDLLTNFGEITIAWGWRWFNLWEALVVYVLVFICDLLIGFVEIIGAWEWRSFNLRESLVIYVSSLTFMLGIRHKGDWLNKRFSLTQSMVRWYMEVPDLVGFLNMSIIGIFLLYFMSTCTFYYVALMIVLSWLLFCLYVGYKHGSITSSSYGSWYVLIGWWMVIECMR